MKKIVLVGNVACGKTTLCQRLNGLKLQYEKTQALNVVNCTIDTPGEYLEHRSLMRGLTVVSADTDYVVFVQDASRDLYLYSPGQAAAFPVPVIGVVSKADIATEKQIAQMGGEAQLFREVMVWMRRVEQACGRKPVLYVGQQFVNNHLVHAPAALRSHDVWVARYGAYKPYVRLLHWQLTPYGRVNGIKGEVDINVFNGTRRQFEEYLQKKR